MRGKTTARVLVTVVAYVLAVDSGFADLQVTESKITAYPVGMKLPDQTEFDIPEDSSVRLLMIPSGTQFLITGPFRGQAGDYMNRKRSWFEKLLGPEREQEEPVGGTRGVSK